MTRSRESSRILKAGGKLIICHFDWIPLEGNVVWHTEKLIQKYNPKWAFGDGNGIYPRWFRHMGETGFTDIRSFSYDEDAPYSHEGWKGRIRASAGVAASLQPKEVAKFDSELAKVLNEKFPDDELRIPHRVFAVYGAKS